jgi:hypothetical protein
MRTGPNRGIDETKAFVFDVLVGVGGLLGVGYAGYEMGVFTGVADTFPSIVIFGGVLLGASSVTIMESERFHILFERPIVGVVSATAMMCLVAGIVWAVSRAGPSRAMYTVLGVIVGALVTRICVFASRRTRSEGATQ